jgi:hypothetical protein
MILFQSTKELIETGLTITPYSGAAYGALVVVLAFAVAMLWRKLNKSEEDYKKLAEEVVEVLAKISIRLEDTKNNGELLKELKNTLDLIKGKLLG